MKRLLFVVLVGCTLVAASVRTGHWALLAQQRTPILVTRVYAGADGQTKAEQIKRMVTPGDRELAKVTGVFLQRQAADLFQDWHTAPRRQYIITLSGRGEIELPGGEKIPFGPGRIFLMENVTGKGHIYRGLGTDEHISLVIPVVEQ